MSAADTLVATLRTQRMRWVTVREPKGEGDKGVRLRVEAPSLFAIGRLVEPRK